MKTTTSTVRASRPGRAAPFMLFAAAIALALCVLALTATSAQSAERRATTPVTGGKTFLVLDRGTAAALSEAGVSVKATGPAFGPGKGGVFAFPIAGGELDKKQLGGRIVHSGGLSFAAGDTKVVVKRFVIDLKRGVLTAKVAGGGRVPLLSLTVPRDGVISAPGLLVLKGVKAKLTPQAAAALNAAFDTDLFQAGLPIGKAKVIARTGA